MSRSFTTRPTVARQDGTGVRNPGSRGAENVNHGGARARSTGIPSTSTQPPQQHEEPTERVQRYVKTVDLYWLLLTTVVATVCCLSDGNGRIKCLKL